MLLAQQAEWEESKAKVLAAATITLGNAQSLAVSAVCGEYDLTPAQCDQLAFVDDLYGMSFHFVDDRPVTEMNLYLTQKKDYFTEKDGIYVVTVCLDDGVIDDIFYDSGMASNG